MFAPPEVSDIHYTTLLGEDTISALCFSHTRAVECADFGCKNQGKGQPLRQIQKNLGQNLHFQSVQIRVTESTSFRMQGWAY